MMYKVADTDLTLVADAIRTKGDTRSPLSFPDGFVAAVGNIPTGGGSTLITKSISANGTYDAEDDNADGYSSVSVSVPSRHVRGTFTGTTEGSAMNVNVPYTGSGYPVSCVIYPTSGVYNSSDSLYSLVKRYAVLMFAMAKCNVSEVPTYNNNSAEANKASCIALFKNPDSDATSNAASRGVDNVFYTTNAATASSTTAVRFSNSTTMSIFIAGTSYGFVPNVEYTYEIIYSS